MTWQRASAFGLVAILPLAAHAGAQQPPATFTAGNRTVAVYATVTDAGGRLVPDLGRDQFQIDDNGKRQELTLFANEIQPITVVMLLDRSTSMHRNFELVEKAAEEFVGVMLPADKARIGSFSDRIQVDPRDFTSDHDELLKILQTELQTEGPTPLERDQRRHHRSAASARAAGRPHLHRRHGRADALQHQQQPER